MRALSTEAAATGQAKIDALRAWQQGSQAALPAELPELSRDSNPRVRAAVIEAAALRRPPETDNLVASALQDPDLQVRLAAVAALGILGGEQAAKTLDPYLDDRGELVRAAAARALIRLGVEGTLLRAEKDKSWRVRLVAAESLARFPDATGTQVARRLVVDPSAAVQAAVVHGVAQWPLPQAGPILLAAMAGNARSTRQAATAALAARWPAAADWPIDASPAQRAEALSRFQSALRNQFPAVAEMPAAGSNPARPSRQVRPEDLADAERCLAALASAASTREKEQAARRLATVGPGLVDVLEVVASRSSSPLPEAVYQDVLPRCAPEFAALAQLRSSDLATRRRAAEELASLGDRQTLGWLALARLGAVVEKESDPVVWRWAMKTIARDAGDPSFRLAYAGLRHPAPEVRRMACAHLAAHPSTKHAAALAPVLGDSHVEIVREAVRAIGAGGGLEDRQPLKRMLGSTDESLRVEAATALARLGDPAGPPALERLAHSSDLTVRRQAAAAMGQAPNPAYKATLIGLLDDQHSVRLAALESLAKIAGPDDATAQAARQGTVEDRIGRWKQKFQNVPSPAQQAQ